MDTAQGQEADVVFIDMVRKYGTEHMDDAERLCVEVIFMASSAVKERKDGKEGKTLANLAAIWEKCESGETTPVRETTARVTLRRCTKQLALVHLLPH